MACSLCLHFDWLQHLRCVRGLPQFCRQRDVSGCKGLWQERRCQVAVFQKASAAGLRYSLLLGRSGRGWGWGWDYAHLWSLSALGPWDGNAPLSSREASHFALYQVQDVISALGLPRAWGYVGKRSQGPLGETLAILGGNGHVILAQAPELLVGVRKLQCWGSPALFRKARFHPLLESTKRQCSSRSPSLLFLSYQASC